MRKRIIKIGHPQGIGIPRLLLEQTNLAKEVELEVQDNQIVIRAAEQPRQGWEAAFRSTVEHSNDQTLDENLVSQTYWDEAEWQW